MAQPTRRGTLVRPSNESHLAHRTGSVILEVILGSDGSISNFKILKALGDWRYGFEEAAIKGVQQWRFKPGIYKGKPADVRMSVKLDFGFL